MKITINSGEHFANRGQKDLMDGHEFNRTDGAISSRSKVITPRKGHGSLYSSIHFATDVEYHKTEQIKELPRGRKVLHFWCNPFTRRYRFRPVVKPIIALVLIGVASIIFFIMAVLVRLVRYDHYPSCKVEYPSYNKADTKDNINVNYPWVEMGTSICTPEDGCYRDDVITVGPNLCTALDDNNQMVGNVVLYYSLEPYYQNHRRYALSRNSPQLHGLDWDGTGITFGGSTAMSLCTPLQTLSDLNEQYGIITTSKDGLTSVMPGYPPINDLNDDYHKVVIYPCGLQAFSVFNDFFSMSTHEDIPVDIPLYDSPRLISADPDLNYFKRVDETKYPKRENVYEWLPSYYYDDVAGNGVENSHFMNWMRLSSGPVVQKLFAVLNEYGDDSTIKPPFRIKVRNRYNISSWGGKKFVILTTMPSIGRVPQICYDGLIALGCFSTIFGIAYTMKYMVHPRILGDVRFIDGRYNTRKD